MLLVQFQNPFAPVVVQPTFALGVQQVAKPTSRLCQSPQTTPKNSVVNVIVWLKVPSSVGIHTKGGNKGARTSGIPSGAGMPLSSLG